MSTEEEKDPIAQLKELRAGMRLGGGKKRIEAQHSKGKYTARERVEMLLDEGTFSEVAPFMEHRFTDFDMEGKRFPGDAVVTGFGKINGRTVAVFAQDFTVIGGSFSEVVSQRVCRVLDLAMEAGVPLIAINDSGGARIQEGIYSLWAYGELFWRNTQASGVIPQISVMMGPCAGGAVYSPGLTDFIIMTQNTSHMFITGPQVIKAVTGEEVDFETLGGAMVHSSRSGVAHFAAENEDHTIETVKALLSYLPSNNAEKAPAVEPADDPWRMDEWLNELVPQDPNQPYDMRQVVEGIFDRGSFLEVHANFAPNALVGFARLHGQVVGIAANQPAAMAGVIDIDASDKIARFVRFCDCFNIPLVALVDTPGFMPGTVQEHGGIIRHGAKIVYAFSEATVPVISLVTRKGYGGAYIVMASRSIHADLAYTWPTGELAVMGADGAVNILYGKELKGADNAEEARAKYLEEYREKFGSPYPAARSGNVDDVIIPAETRPRLIAALELLKDKKKTLPPKKHGNMPV